MAPPVTYEEALEEAMAVGRTDITTTYTLEFINADWPATLRICEGFEELVAGLEEDAPDGEGGIAADAGELVIWTPAPVDITLPTTSPGQEPVLLIEAFDPSARIVRAANAALKTGSRKITYIASRAYTSDDLSKPASSPTLLIELKDVRAVPSAGKITGRATLSSFLNLSCPWKSYNIKEYPTLR